MGPDKNKLPRGWVRHFWHKSGTIAATDGERPPLVRVNGAALRPAAGDEPSRYETLFRHAPVGYMVLDAAGVIELVNHSGAAMLGWDEYWLIGKPFERWVLTSDQPAYRDFLRRLSRDATRVSEDLRVRNRQGRALSIRIEGSREPGVADLYARRRCILIDMSSEKQSARKLRNLQSQLTHVSRLHTAGELAASLAHELNQPLGTVMLNCDAALRMLDNDECDDFEFAEVLLQAREAADFASEVVRHLRGFLRKDGDDRCACNLAALIRDVATLIEVEARDSDIDIEIGVSDSLPAVSAYPIQIEQVVLNLAHNGIEAIRDAGAWPRRVSISARARPAGEVLITVADTGPGLEPKQAGLMFTPFFTTKDDGMGMGLSISRTIVEAHGGKLWADSQPDAGTRLFFTLPVHQDAADAR